MFESKVNSVTARAGKPGIAHKTRISVIAPYYNCELCTLTVFSSE